MDALDLAAARLAEQYPHRMDAMDLKGFIKLILWVLSVTNVLKVK